MMRKNCAKQNVTFACFKKLALHKVGKQPELKAHQNFYPVPEPHQNNAAPQHCFYGHILPKA
jgi:hypothetical protein